MGRAKIPIKWIPKETSRNVTFMKRKKGLKKKVEELGILCGVEACMVCFGPQITDQPSDPDVWPGMPKALQVIDRYKSLSKEEQDKKKLDNSSFLEQRIKKLRVELAMKKKENRELEIDTLYPSWDNRLNYFSVEKLRELLDYIDARLAAVHDRIGFLSRQEQDVENTMQVPLTELESIARQSMEGTAPQMMFPYNLMPCHESFTSVSGTVKPYLSLEDQYTTAMCSSSEPNYATAIDYYPSKDHSFVTALRDYQTTFKEQLYAVKPIGSSSNNNNNMDQKMVNTDSMAEDRITGVTGYSMMNKSFPLMGDYEHVQSSAIAGNCSQWRCAVTPLSCCSVHTDSIHNSLYSFPQHYMNPYGQTANQQTQASCEPQHHQSWLNELIDLQNIQQKLLGDGIDFARNNARLPPPLVDRSGTDQDYKLKNLQDLETLQKMKPEYFKDDALQ
eukprot:Gb_38883 [translate_table: standard]